MRLTSLVLVTLLVGCGNPISMLPGGALDGVPTPAPADWSSVANVKTIQVEFRPSDPYSHNVWCVGLGRDLYIATSGKGTRWTPFLAADPRVRVRVVTALYNLTAVPVTEAAEQARVGDAYSQKYDIKADDNWVADGGLIFRLDRRD